MTGATIPAPTTAPSTAEALIAALTLAPHPEGGWYRQTWIDRTAEGRPHGTAILFLLKAGERSHWHKVDAAEIWFWHGGAPLILSRAASEVGPAMETLLGPDVLAGQMPQLVVETDHWQAAATTGDYTLVSCTVSPGFRFEGFELAPPGWELGGL